MDRNFGRRSTTAVQAFDICAYDESFTRWQTRLVESFFIQKMKRAFLLDFGSQAFPVQKTAQLPCKCWDTRIY